MTAAWRPAPLELAVDLARGGRWTSLRSAGREWLWAHPDPAVRAARPGVRPGDAFVDAGGVEECFPCLRGRSDHGEAWSRPWTPTADGAHVDLPGGTRLARRVRRDAGAVRVDHTVTGPPGLRFVHAVHALLDLGTAARLVVPGGTTMVDVGDGTDPAGATRPWPSGLDALGPDDGTATCVVLPRCREVTVVDGPHSLTFAWSFPGREELCSAMIWRNLGGWPAEGPYRSVGVEPMIGRSPDPEAGDASASCRLDASGRARWSLRVTAAVREP